MSLCCMFDNGRRLVRRDVRIRIFSRYQEQPRPTSELLQARGVAVTPGSSLDVFRDIYRMHGWRASRLSAVPSVSPQDPTLIPPHLQYCTHYELLGVSVRKMEALVQEFVAGFSLQSIMLRLCEEFDGTASLEAAFPFARQVRDALEHKMRNRKKKTTKPPPEIERVIPIATLPLLLSLLPDCYQRASNTLQECERLRVMIVDAIPLEQRSHTQLQRQLQLMDTNRHHVAFLQQQALHFNQVPLARRDPERQLFEADLLTITEQRLEDARQDEERNRKIRRQAKRLSRELGR